MESQSFSSSLSSTKAPSSHSTLHSVRKIPAKPWKKPITPPRIYKVKSIDFKQVVQKLTGASESQSRRLQRVAPPPLTLSSTQSAISDNSDKAVAVGSTLEQLLFPNTTMTPLSATFPDLGAVSPLGFSLSPSSSLEWFSFLLQSPGTLSSFQHSTVL
ncbi:hypothetical protein ACSBR2_003935 [Camellia fascicularis]